MGLILLTRSALLVGDGNARRKAMELLVRYAEALGAERFVDTTNVAGVPGQSSTFLHNYYKDVGEGYDVIFSRYDLDNSFCVNRTFAPPCRTLHFLSRPRRKNGAAKILSSLARN